ncbi:DUF2971 domain-containing protein [Bradyrhizobium xenonodulans]|uniref:DUF2971 domain-containing protein n=1 Tax=Bradyrhizobium xenonodulans TaxID=2736875 RepID=A0ABY7MK30_9BRAD|nr:DUF2971 domain-containing protein [Bradyrhizobium xenonodulans]WBL78748.1 DUF2971 domain-containing protein [Bradyrhizobium xenonodulans]
MNDAMEGFYDPTEGLRGTEDFKRVVRRIYDAKSDHGIACFSETNANELMWAHYADNYAGICVQYKTQALIDGLPRDVRVARVAYGDSPPPIGPDEALNSRNSAIKILSHKKANWSYEREWRVMGRVGQNSYDDERVVTAIYFGSRIDPQHRSQIIQQLDELRVEFFEMSVEGYKHVFRAINPDQPRRRRGARGA